MNHSKFRDELTTLVFLFLFASFSLSLSVIRSYKDIEPYISGADVVPAFPSLVNQHSAMAWSLMHKLPVARLGVDNTTSRIQRPTARAARAGLGASKTTDGAASGLKSATTSTSDSLKLLTTPSSLSSSSELASSLPEMRSTSLVVDSPIGFESRQTKQQLEVAVTQLKSSLSTSLTNPSNHSVETNAKPLPVLSFGPLTAFAEQSNRNSKKSSLPPLVANPFSGSNLDSSLSSSSKLSMPLSSSSSEIAAPNPFTPSSTSSSSSQLTPTCDQHPDTQQWKFIRKIVLTPTIAALFFGASADTPALSDDDNIDNLLHSNNVAPKVLFRHVRVSSSSSGPQRRYTRIAAPSEWFASNVTLPDCSRWSHERCLIVREYPEPACVSRHLHSLSLNQCITVQIPSGAGLPVSQLPSGHLVCIAGGTGFLPFVDLLHMIAQEAASASGFNPSPSSPSSSSLLSPRSLSPSHRCITLIISQRSPDEVVAAQYLSLLSNSFPLWIRVRLNFPSSSSQPSSPSELAALKSLDRFRLPYSFGRPSAKELSEWISAPFSSTSRTHSLSESHYYLCGPTRFEMEMVNVLSDFSVSDENVHVVPS